MKQQRDYDLFTNCLRSFAITDLPIYVDGQLSNTVPMITNDAILFVPTLISLLWFEIKMGSELVGITDVRFITALFPPTSLSLYEAKAKITKGRKR